MINWIQQFQFVRETTHELLLPPIVNRELSSINILWTPVCILPFEKTVNCFFFFNWNNWLDIENIIRIFSNLLDPFVEQEKIYWPEKKDLTVCIPVIIY